MNMNTKRWALVRRSTGSVVRKFATRSAGRMAKRNSGRNVVLFDTMRGIAVR
jgi:hypothetical protein